MLPNLLTVGAVDKAGDEASFTSYGPTVVVHANGYQVESVIPGGEQLAESGTSMASPQVVESRGEDPRRQSEAHAAADDRADPRHGRQTADGRRTLINPKKALAMVEPRATP